MPKGQGFSVPRAETGQLIYNHFTWVASSLLFKPAPCPASFLRSGACVYRVIGWFAWNLGPPHSYSLQPSRFWCFKGKGWPLNWCCRPSAHLSYVKLPNVTPAWQLGCGFTVLPTCVCLDSVPELRTVKTRRKGFCSVCLIKFLKWKTSHLALVM